MRKKNKTMRAAGALFLATMLTTSMTAGTFAKYTTGDSASDSARVAKFGVVVQAEGSLFADTYIKATNTPGASSADIATLSVVSSTSTSGILGVNAKDKVVAPGTKNDDGITFRITGTPEVATKVQVDVTVNHDIVLKKITGTDAAYANLITGGNLNDSFNPASDYYPVKYTLTQTKGSGATASTTHLVDKGTLSQIEDALEALTTTIDYNANVNLSNEIGTLKLTWEWAFDDSSAGTYDKEDTLLGDLAASNTIDAYTNSKAATTPTWTHVPENLYDLNADVEITVTVTQVD